jgi:nucleoside-triphosphatase THEP1/Fe2+ or Zn2+ uptake regulation protein
MWQTRPISNIYNPLNQTEKELMKNFVVREREFNTIFNDIKSSEMSRPEPHFIIQGQRGQGKTTLLLKFYYEIKRNKKLNQFIVPVIFNEEQYHISSLFGLWSHAAEKLEEEDEAFTGIYNTVESLFDSVDSEIEAFKALEGALTKRKRKLILLIDNIGHLFDKFTRKEQQRLREVLITSPEIRIIGASAKMMEYTYDYSNPFYELFRMLNLEGLTKEETVTLLLKLGEHYKQESIKKIVKEEPGRIEALRRLTGGVPRTIVLLFEIFVDHEKGNAFQDLEFVLDQVTPLYKHRMDDLSAQQQKIVDAIALNWDAIATKEIATKTRMESKAVSSHLKLLEKNRIIHKIKTDTKNHLYQVTERFFNIWYLMRCGRRSGINRVQWLVHFLESWCSEAELMERAKKHINALEKGTLYPKYAFYMTEALARTQISMELHHDLITHTRNYLNGKDKNLIKELSKSDIELFTEAEENLKKSEFEKALINLEAIKSKDGRALHYLAMLYNIVFKNFKKAEYYYLQAVKKGNVDAMNNLAVFYQKKSKNFEKAEKYYLMAIEKGLADAVYNLAFLYDVRMKDNVKAEKLYLMAIEKGDSWAMNNLARMYFQVKQNKVKALELIKEAVKKENKIIFSYNLSLIMLWNNEIEESLKIIERGLMENKEYIERSIAYGSEFLILLLAKKQYYAALKIFNENPFDLKERLKPIYYALMYFLKDDYPNEYKKMGAELKETVEEIINKVRQWEKDYA